MIPNSAPTISIITVTLNSKKLLTETILSVIEQTYSSIEFIIIDGASTDGTLDLIKKYDKDISFYVSEKDDGIYDAMNKGLSKASGKYVQFLNAGEYFHKKDSLSKIVSLAPFECDVIYGDIWLIDDARNIKRHHKAMDLTIENLKRYGTGVLCHQAMLVKKEVATPYDCKYKYKSELNWYFDILESNAGVSTYHYKAPFVVYSLGGVGYQNFIRNRLEWYQLLNNRYGLKAIINKEFLVFIFNDFKYRYGFIRRIIEYCSKTQKLIKTINYKIKSTRKQ